LDPLSSGRRARGRNDLGDRTRYLEGVEELISEGESTSNVVEPSSEPVKVIWGTNIVITETIAAFKSFLRNFSLAQRHLYEQQSDSASFSVPMLDDSLLAADMEPFYPKMLKKVHIFIL
jgi:hypothetical protein